MDSGQPHYSWNLYNVNRVFVTGASQILGEMDTNATHGREPIDSTYVVAACALQLGLKFPKI
jgi:hypothetical protein